MKSGSWSKTTPENQMNKLKVWAVLNPKKAVVLAIVVAAIIIGNL